MPRIVTTGWGPVRVINASASTGASGWHDADPSHSAWGIACVGGNSTSTVHAEVYLQATLDVWSTAPTATSLSTWSSTGGAPAQSDGEVVYVTGRPAGRIRAWVQSISSTSSTAPTLSVYVGGA